MPGAGSVPERELHLFARMISILSLLLVMVFSLLVVRIATVALTLTGLSQHLSRFQARSAFTGAGFTTSESEKVMKHPVRRRIILLLMLLGNAGIITAVSSLILSFMRPGGEGLFGAIWLRLTVLGVGVAVLWLVAHSQWIDVQLSRLVEHLLRRWTDLEVRDYAGLLHLAGDYSVAELQIGSEDWLAGRELGELRLSDEGVLVLGVEKAQGNYLGAPRGRTRLDAGDTLVVYGPKATLENLDTRVGGYAGSAEHREAVKRQRESVQREEAEQQKLEQQAATGEETSTPSA